MNFQTTPSQQPIVGLAASQTIRQQQQLPPPPQVPVLQLVDGNANDVYISANQQQYEQQVFFPHQNPHTPHHIIIAAPATPYNHINTQSIIDPCQGDENTGAWVGFLVGFFLSPFISIPVALTFANKVKNIHSRLYIF
jgi:hypothetical protein